VRLINRLRNNLTHHRLICSFLHPAFLQDDVGKTDHTAWYGVCGKHPNLFKFFSFFNYLSEEI